MEERIARKKGEPRLLLSLLCVPRTAASGIARWLLRVDLRRSRALGYGHWRGGSLERVVTLPQGSPIVVASVRPSQ